MNASQLANCSLQDSMAAPRKIETSVDELWVEELQPAQKPSSSLNTISSDLSAMSLFPNDALRHTKQGNTMSKLTNKRPRGN